MSSAPEETVPKLRMLSVQDRAAIQAGRRVLHLRHRGDAHSVHDTDAGVFVTGNGNGNADSIAGGARFESEAAASTYIHRKVATNIRNEIANEGNGFYRSWSACDGFVTVEHEILYTRWHVVIGNESPIVHTMQLGFDDVRAGWRFVEETLDAAGINLQETDLAEPQRADSRPYSVAGDLFGPIDRPLREALVAGERVLFLPHRGQCYTVHRTSVGPVVTHNGLGDDYDFARAAVFTDEGRAVDFAHKQVAKCLRADAHRGRDGEFNTFTVCMGHVAVEHDQYRGRWTVVLGSEARPFVHIREYEPEDIAAGYRFVHDTIEGVGLILEPGELDRHLDRGDVPAPEIRQATDAEPEPVDVHGHQDQTAPGPGRLRTLIRRLTGRH